MSRAADSHYSTIEPYRNRNYEDLRISNSNHPVGEQHEQQDDAMLVDINSVVTVTPVVREDGRVIETVELATRPPGVYEPISSDQHLQQPTGEYEPLRRLPGA